MTYSSNIRPRKRKETKQHNIQTYLEAVLWICKSCFRLYKIHCLFAVSSISIVSGLIVERSASRFFRRLYIMRIASKLFSSKQPRTVLCNCWYVMLYSQMPSQRKSRFQIIPKLIFLCNFRTITRQCEYVRLPWNVRNCFETASP